MFLEENGAPNAGLQQSRNPAKGAADLSEASSMLLLIIADGDTVLTQIELFQQVLGYISNVRQFWRQ